MLPDSIAAMPVSAPSPAFLSKIVSRDAVAHALRHLPKPWVFTNGVFDVIHRGHVMYLAQARALGGSLIVALNTDASVRRLIEKRVSDLRVGAERREQKHMDEQSARAAWDRPAAHGVSRAA